MPLKPLHETFARTVNYTTPPRTLNLDDYPDCNYTIWASTPQEFGIHVHLYREGGGRGRREEPGPQNADWHNDRSLGHMIITDMGKGKRVRRAASASYRRSAHPLVCTVSRASAIDSPAFVIKTMPFSRLLFFFPLVMVGCGPALQYPTASRSTVAREEALSTQLALKLQHERVNRVARVYNAVRIANADPARPESWFRGRRENRGSGDVC